MDVSFKFAKLAKENGFKEKCTKAFYSNGKECNYFPYSEAGEHYFRPSQAELQTWLRNYLKIDVLVVKDNYLETMDKYAFTIPHNQGGSHSLYFETYEEALNSGFEFVFGYTIGYLNEKKNKK